MLEIQRRNSPAIKTLINSILESDFGNAIILSQWLISQLKQLTQHEIDKANYNIETVFCCHLFCQIQLNYPRKEIEADYNIAMNCLLKN